MVQFSGSTIVWLCDNVVVSINLPQSSENVGTFLSRSTHPRYLALAQALMRIVTDRGQLTITNTLFGKTKKEWSAPQKPVHVL